MSKLIVEQIQKPGGTPIAWPAAPGTAGQLLGFDSSGNLTPVSVTDIKMKLVTLYDYDRDAGQTVNAVDLRFSALGLTPAQITNIEFEMSNLMSSSGGWQLYLTPLNAQGANAGGYMGFQYFNVYGGNGTTQGQSHNSNNGYIWFPQWTSMYSGGDDAYGSSMTGRIQVAAKRGRNGTYQHTVNALIAGNMHSSYSYPAIEMSSWDNLSTNQPWPNSLDGFRFTLSNGNYNFAGGSLIAKVYYR